MAATRLALAALLLAGAAHAEGGATGASVDGGIATAWTFTPAAADSPTGVLEVTVTDQRTGNPVRYERGAVLGWLQRVRPALVETPPTCAERVRALATRGVGQRSDVELNGYRIVTLNADGSLAFINPFIGFNNAKLETILDLGGVPVDWVQDASRMDAWVLIAAAGDAPGRLVEVDLQSRAVRRAIDLPAGARASRLALGPGGQRLWVALPGTGAVGSVALGTDGAPLETRPAAGITGLLAAPDGAVLGWTGTGDVLSPLDSPGLPPRIVLPAAPVAIVQSGNAAATLVGAADGTVLLQPDGSDAPGETIALGHPLGAMALFDEGRFLLAVGGGRASVVDLATRQVTLAFPVQADADSIAMTDLFAYALGGASGRASMVALGDLRRGRPQVLDIIVGAPGGAAAPDLPGAPARAAAVPEGNGLLLASDGDGMIYQYSEGMMAPTGSYSNYRRAAVGLAIVDYSLRPVAPGRLSTVLRADAGGSYDLILGGIGPRFSSCTRIALPGAGAGPAVPVLRAVLVSADAPGTETERVRVRVLEALPGRETAPLTGLRDVTLLVFDKQSGWQRRVVLADVGGGEYEGAVHVPHRTAYELLASSSAANLSFVEGRLGERELGLAP